MSAAQFQQDVENVVTNPAIGYGQRVRHLATLADNQLPYPALSDACRQALDERVICDMYEGNRPFTPRYVLPDYAKALREGVRYLELEPPTDLDDALSFLTILYGHVPSVTTYPVYLGDLDSLLEPYVPAALGDDELDRKLRRFWIQLDRLLPDAFVHADLGPTDGRVVRSILRVERSLRQVVPNLTLKVDPDLTPDDLVADAVRTVFETGKPHFVNHPMMVADHGERYAVVSCYNSLKVGGGAHSLVRLNLKEAALRHAGSPDSFLAEELPHWVELTCELGEARIRSLVEQQRFFDTHFLATEGLVELDRFSLMFGVYGMAECVNLLMAQDGRPGERYGHSEDANQLSYAITRRVADLVAARPLPYCGGGGGHAYLHAQSGIDLDLEVTAGTRIPVGDEPGMREHITTCAPHHVFFDAGISDVFHVDDTAVGNPQAMVDIIRGAFDVGMRDYTFNLDSNEFIRITGYLVRKSDLVGIEEHGARHSSDYLAATAEQNHTVTTRAVKRITAVELTPVGVPAAAGTH
ncbi:MAG: YjjI family glycine radical enzyme [Propionicimonas sp.]|uniref:YjjI family glycine radical enzyme n=1 Tax=Propionicimonas sp. TaxID=1955623 RepID=UPI002B1EAD9B|nr:YjjI family glycine radical enzyme [Propionicimonas sp.]MEA4944221.1 YjjI family glycine radical enzyme [Propionicimonas sp.]MEA5053803.1 YjjI family glycine radical enzyme [Propionicimonas sp.]MEA5116907.1 YjjI family glycine radical enzyme [Propionicimonas sp.]